MFKTKNKDTTMSPSLDECSFYMHLDKGHTLKSCLEFLNQSFNDQRIKFQATPKGVTIRERNSRGSITVNIDIPQKNLTRYRCKKDLCFNLGLRDTYSHLKTMKKADSLLLYILKDEMTYLTALITSHSKSTKSVMTENYTFPISILEMWEEIILPEQVESESGEIFDVYDVPKVIPISDFQRLKKIITSNETIRVTALDNEYVSFEGIVGNISRPTIKFGEEITDYETKYISDFSNNEFTILNKISTGSSVKFYIPMIEDFPLKVEFELSHKDGIYGDVKIYLDDNHSINSKTSEEGAWNISESSCSINSKFCEVYKYSNVNFVIITYDPATKEKIKEYLGKNKLTYKSLKSLKKYPQAKSGGVIVSKNVLTTIKNYLLGGEP